MFKDIDWEKIVNEGLEADASAVNLVWRASGSVVSGNVAFGKDCSVWYNAVVRGDDAPISIGHATNSQDCAVLHTDIGYPIRVGNQVTIGHGARVHGCRIGDATTIGMGAIVMNGARVGRNSIVAAGSVVTENKEFPDGVLIMGTPAKVVRELTLDEIRYNAVHAEDYVRTARKSLTQR
ncbi:MAG: gamma carbonic anhydrase family protein [Lachnospiraceae bacterium]|nr:gamma carbonic anhydrase family protein [Lachnospiraceae bacterium]